jgi:3-hydroxyisobutyrate dehydrogenase
MGDIGSGQLTKMVNQICFAGLIQALAEGINFAQKSGLDVEKALNVISHGAASSWQMVNRYPTMLQNEYNHGFAVDWMRKDLAICLAEAAKNGAQLPITALVNQFYADIQALGGGRWDTSSLFASAPKAKAANTPLWSAKPPQAITGICTTSTIAGTNTKEVTSPP